MTKIIIPITCFVMAILTLGCQEHEFSDSSAEIEHRSTDVTQVNEKKDVVNTAKTQEENDPIVIAYYFHRTMRCPTCLAIEANAARVIDENFSHQVADETLTWMPFNLDEPGGEELEKEFDVSGSTLLLAKTKDGNFIKHKKLEKVWDLIGDPLEFDNYVKSELTLFLNE